MGAPDPSPSKGLSVGLGSAIVRVFVSSTWHDLQPERRAVETALARLRETKFVGMEHFGSREETTFDTSLAEVDQSDLYLGIMAGRYGSGITEAEYRRARERGLPCLFYIKQSPAWSEDDPAQAARLEAFLAEIERHHIVDRFTKPDDLAARVTAGLHQWLFDKFLVPRLEEALRGKRTRQEADEILSALRSPEDLGQDLVARLEQAGFALSQAPRSIAVGGAVMRSILVTGDHNRVFVGSFETLADSYIEPWPVFERLRLDRFTGRGWLTAAVDSFLENHDRGCFLLEADAGLGKSAFLAHLVRKRGWIHHFVERAPGQDNIGLGLRNLAAQIALAWRLEPYTSQWLLPAAASRPDFLETLLFEAARRRDEVSPGEKIVVAVDALDESAALPDQNVLGLPKVLPQGVYLVLSQRPVDVALTIDSPRQVLRLTSTDLKNLEDMREFLENAVDLPTVETLLAESGIARDDFIATLLDRSGGVWIYLHYVLAEIERGERRPLELEKLPCGLWQYYAEYWRRRRAGATWDGLELPLLATLAAIQEELPVHLLCAFAGISEAPQVHRLLREAWRPFLAISDSGERRYRCYHASFREFLDGSSDRSGLTAAQQALADELAVATLAAHSRIADRFLAAWGGLDGGLEGLRTPTGRTLDGGYGLRHLVTHLDKAGRLKDLEQLLKLSWGHDEHRENGWYTVHEEERDLAGYTSDLIRVFRAAYKASQEAIDRGEPALTVLLELHCAYWMGSICSLASQVPPALLAALLEKGIWSKEHALAYAHQIPKAQQRFLAMAHLIALLPEPTRSEALSESVAAAHSLSSWGREKAYPALPSNTPRELLQELMRQELASSIKEQRQTLPILARKLPEDLLREALSSLHKAEPSLDKVFLLSLLAPFAPSAERGKLIQDVISATTHPSYNPWRMELLLPLIEFLPEDERERVTRDALDLARKEKYLSQKVFLFAHTIPFLQEGERERVAREAFDATLELDGYRLRHALSQLVPHLSGTVFRLAEKRILKSAKYMWELEDYLPALVPRWTDRPDKINEAFSRIEKSTSWNTALVTLTPFLPNSLLERALKSALKVYNQDARLAALDRLAPRLSRQQLEKALEHILTVNSFGNLTIYEGIRSTLIIRLAVLGRNEACLNEAKRLTALAGTTLAEIVQLVSPGDLHRVQDIALKLPKPADRAAALVGIAALTSGNERSRLLSEAARSIQKISHFGRDRRVELFLATARLLEEPAQSQALRKVLQEIRSQAKNWVASKLSELVLSVIPYLSEPLLREALTLADIFDKESDAQTSFREMVPRLPEDLAAEALLLDPSSRFRKDTLSAPLQPTLGIVGRFLGWFWALVPERCAPWAGGVVLGVAACLPSKLSRARLLIANAFDKDGYVTDVWQDAVAAARKIPSPRERAEALINLTKAGYDSTAYWALASALAIEEPAPRAEALEKLAPYLNPYLEARLRQTAKFLRQPSPGRSDATDALERLQECASTSAIRELLDLTDTEQEPLIQKALEIAKKIQEPTLRAWALLDLVPYLPENEGADLVRNCLREIHSAPEAGPLIVSRWVRRKSPLAEPVARALLKAPIEDLSPLLVAAAPHLPSEVLPEVLEEVWKIGDSDHQIRALQALAPRLASLPAAGLHPLWADALGSAAGRGGHAVYALLGAFLPVVEKLGGRQALETLMGWEQFPANSPS